MRALAKQSSSTLERSSSLDCFTSFAKTTARATGKTVKSIRYDERMPRELKERLEEIGNLINLTANYFNGDLTRQHMNSSKKNFMHFQYQRAIGSRKLKMQFHKRLKDFLLKIGTEL